MAYDYILHDLAGYPFNSKYPPNYNLNGSLYHGYRNNTEETFYYDFAVQRYDLRFVIFGKEYFFLSCEEHASLCDASFTQEFQVFRDGNAALEEFMIEGERLIDLIPVVEEVEVF